MGEFMDIKKAKQYVKEQARPLELELYRYFFENGTQQAVIEELVKFQNEDGGFGHGLEADNWNPNSNPIATNDAIITLYKMKALKKDAKIVLDIVSYLKSQDSFDAQKRRWLFAIDSNKDYPHAIWWEKDRKDDGISAFNPTVSLATFMLCFGDNPDYYEELIKEAFADLETTKEISGDALKCYLLSYELLRENKIDDVISFAKTKELLIKRIEDEICKDKSKYGIEYVSRPSDFFQGIYAEFMSDEIRKWVEVEQSILSNLQKEDGGFDISWTWNTPYPEFEQARNWWRPKVTMNMLLFCSM